MQKSDRLLHSAVHVEQDCYLQLPVGSESAESERMYVTIIMEKAGY